MSLRSITGVVLTAVLAAGSATACGGSGDDSSVQVAVLWSGTELTRFREVVDGFEHDKPGIRVEAISTGDDMDGFLRARARAGNLPDVAVLSRPGLIGSYADRGWLQPLSEELADRYAPFWEDLGRDRNPDGPLYGAWIKGSYKSLFWYRPADLAAADAPTNWETFETLVRDRAEPGGPAPLAIGAADAWVLTDWLENLLLAHSATDPDLYLALARGEPRWCEQPVMEAFDDLATLWGTDDAIVGGGERAFLTQFDESVIQVAATGEGVMLQGSEFVQALTGGVLAEGALHEAQEPLGSFPFPSPTPVQPVILGGDVAVVMTGSGRGEDLVSWLAQPGSFTSWIEAGGYLSPVLNAAGDYPDPTGDYAPLVAQPGADAQFDLSDQLGGEVARRIGPELQSLFSAVAFGSVSGGHEASALRTAREGASRLNEAAGGHAC